MCGIFGAISFDGLFDRAAFQTFVGLTDLVRYRGPDDSGYVRLNVGCPERDPSQGFDVFLGSRRLAIIDLSAAGHQPMHDRHSRWITFNGEIFNYVELRRELKARGHAFSTGTDTEVILHLYDEYGEDGFRQLNGMWAFALVDAKRRRVVLSRDRFSIKPLYTLRLPGRLYFASEIKQLIPLLPSRDLNVTVMSQFLIQGLLDHTHDTFFESIQRVPAKTNVVAELQNGGGVITEKRYWNFNLPQRVSTTDERDIIAEFRHLFSDSVRIRLRSDVKTGVLLSGGLDSSAIAMTCKGLTNGGVQTYSIVANEKEYSEAKFIDVLTATGIANDKIVFCATDLLRDLGEALYHSDEPFGGFSVLAQYRLLRAAKQGANVTVLLSGQGGDEVLLGYLKFFFFHLRDLVRQGHCGRAAREVVSSLAAGTVLRQFTFREARRYLPAISERSVRMLRTPVEPVPIWSCDDLRVRQVSDIDFYSLPALTHYEDRNASAHSLEVRHPFLDHRLVEFLISLPAEFKIRNGWTKYVLRQSLPELPSAIRWRKDKQPFLTPEAVWLKNELGPLIGSMFVNSKLEEIGVLNSREFLNCYDDFRKGRPIPPTDISRVLIAEVWARQFLD